MNIMRASSLVPAVVVFFVSQPAGADVVRHSAVPVSLRGTWAPSAQDCNKTESAIVLSNKSYVGSKGRCVVEWVSETAGARGAIYSARLQCSGTAAGQQTAELNLILVPSDGNQLSVGDDFNSLKPYQRCPASEPATTR